MKRESLTRWLGSAALLAGGVLIGSAMESSNEAWGEVRTGPPPTAFQSGGQLSVPILKEIAATLHQMDSRLAKLEVVAQKLQAQRK